MKQYPALMLDAQRLVEGGFYSAFNVPTAHDVTLLIHDVCDHLIAPCHKFGDFIPPSTEGEVWASVNRTARENSFMKEHEYVSFVERLGTYRRLVAEGIEFSLPSYGWYCECFACWRNDNLEDFKFYKELKS